MLTADCVVVRHRAEVLLVRRGNEPYKGCWALPGGFMEMVESIECCAVRELMEETGLAVDEKRLRLTAAYRIDVEDDPQATAGDDAAEVRWWPVSALPPLAFDHAEIIAAALAL